MVADGIGDIETGEKAEVGRVSEEKRRRKKIREEKDSEEKRCTCATGRKVAERFVFPKDCGSGGSQRRLAKEVGVDLAQMCKIARR